MPAIKFDLADDVHRRAKAAAALAGKPLKVWITEVVVAALEAEDTEKPSR